MGVPTKALSSTDSNLDKLGMKTTINIIQASRAIHHKISSMANSNKDTHLRERHMVSISSRTVARNQTSSTLSRALTIKTLTLTIRTTHTHRVGQ